jgi:succinoglycan biosynthesis transport protein ExoP
MRLSIRETENSPLQPLGQPLDIRAGRAREGEESEQKSATSHLLVECRRTLVRHRRLILGWGCAGIIAGILLQLPIQPVYRAVVTTEVESPNRVMDSGRTSASTGDLETQMKLLQGDKTIAGVADGLTDDPYSTRLEKRDWLSRLLRTLRLGGKRVIPLPSLIDQSARSVRSWRLGSTQMIGASCDSWNPAFAAKYCNLLAAALQHEDVESRGAMATQTSELLMRQAAAVQAKVVDAQGRLETLNAQDHPASPRNGVDRDRLRQLEAELIKAQADQMAKQAQIEAAEETGSEITPDSVDGKAYALSKARLAELQGRLEVMSQANPHDKRLRRLRSEIAVTETGLSEVRAAGRQRLQAEYDGAKHREDLLWLSYQALAANQPADSTPDSQADQLRRQIAHDRQLYQALLERASEAGFNSATQSSLVRVVEQAKSPQSAIYPHRLMLVAAGLAIGSLAGLGVAFFKDSNRSALRLPGESETLLGVEELGVIPSAIKETLLPQRGHPSALARSQVRQSQASRTAHWDEEFSLVAEAYRNAMLSVTLANPKSGGRAYIVSSPGAGEGKSTVTTNLGVALSKSNRRVILVDADLRRPSLHGILSVPNGMGLRNILRGEVNLSDSSVLLYCKPTKFANLSVIPAGGREQVADLLHTKHFHELMERLLRDFDIVLVDTPPMLHIPDARILAQNTNGAILVFRSGVTSREDAVRAGEVFQQDHVTIVGTILNDFDPASEGRYGYYKSYYAYQQQTAAKDPATNS